MSSRSLFLLGLVALAAPPTLARAAIVGRTSCGEHSLECSGSESQTGSGVHGPYRASHNAYLPRAGVRYLRRAERKGGAGQGVRLRRSTQANPGVAGSHRLAHGIHRCAVYGHGSHATSGEGTPCARYQRQSLSATTLDSRYVSAKRGSSGISTCCSASRKTRVV